MLDNHLNVAYKLITSGKAEDVKKFSEQIKGLIERDGFLKKGVRDKLKSLTDLYEARGDGACYISSVHRRFLEGMLDARS